MCHQTQYFPKKIRSRPQFVCISRDGLSINTGLLFDRICSYQCIIFFRTTRSAHRKLYLRSDFWIKSEKRIQGDLHEIEVPLLTSQTREQAVVSRDHALIDINQFHFRRTERTNQKVLNQLILCCSKSGKLVGVINDRAHCQYWRVGILGHLDNQKCSALHSSRAQSLLTCSQHRGPEYTTDHAPVTCPPLHVSSALAHHAHAARSLAESRVTSLVTWSGAWLSAIVSPSSVFTPTFLIYTVSVYFHLLFLNRSPLRHFSLDDGRLEHEPYLHVRRRWIYHLGRFYQIFCNLV